MNGILSSALSALQTNSAALRVVSNNVANLNTQGYARRVVEQQTLTVGGSLAGVDIADIKRVVDKYLNAEQLSATSSTSQYNAQTGIYSQLDGMIGQPGDGTSLMSKLDNIFSSLSQATLSPTSNASQQGVLNSYQNLASTISSLATSISGLRSQVDQQVSSSIGTVNSLIQQVYSLNGQIAKATAGGDTASALLDQRDTALQSLSQYMDVRTQEQPDGRMTVMTTDGVNLVSDMYAQLSYAGGAANGNYSDIGIQDMNPSTGQPIGQVQALTSHLTAGKLKGLIDMRDGALADMQSQLGSFAQSVSQAYNAQHNANSAVPPPASMTGRNTGLLATDSLGFTGKTTLAVADSSGKLVSRIDIDFDAGTLTVDGGTLLGLGSTVGSFTNAINTALSGIGSASFSNGVLSLSANGGNGLVIQDDATTPSSRGGAGLSQFFGLNDIFQSAGSSLKATGLSASDASGVAAGGVLSFLLRGPDGTVARQASITTTAGMTMGDVVTALNTAMGGQATFALGSDGTLSMTPSAANTGYQLSVTNDSTQRGTTGVSLSQIFGLGTQQLYAQAQNFSVNAALVRQPSRLAFAQANITAGSGIGDSIVSGGDNRGLLALQNVSDKQLSFPAIGTMGAQSGTLGDYATAFYQSEATSSSNATANQTAQNDRLTEATARQSSESGVNLDEELSNMMLYQQGYAAGARMLSVVQQMYDALFQIQ